VKSPSFLCLPKQSEQRDQRPGRVRVSLPNSRQRRGSELSTKGRHRLTIHMVRNWTWWFILFFFPCLLRIYIFFWGLTFIFPFIITLFIFFFISFLTFLTSGEPSFLGWGIRMSYWGGDPLFISLTWRISGMNLFSRVFPFCYSAFSWAFVNPFIVYYNIQIFYHWDLCYFSNWISGLN